MSAAKAGTLIGLLWTGCVICWWVWDRRQDRRWHAMYDRMCDQLAANDTDDEDAWPEAWL